MCDAWKHLHSLCSDDQTDASASTPGSNPQYPLSTKFLFLSPAPSRSLPSVRQPRIQIYLKPMWFHVIISVVVESQYVIKLVPLEQFPAKYTPQVLDSKEHTEQLHYRNTIKMVRNTESRAYSHCFEVGGERTFHCPLITL